MKNRGLAIALTVIIALLCLCPALVSCGFGVAIATGQPVNLDINGVSQQQYYPPSYGFALMCVSLLFVLVPVLVGIFTLRKPKDAPAQPGEPMPPAA